MAIEILLNDGTAYLPLDEDLAKWKEAYPAVNIQEQLKKMDVWSRSNEANRKTRKGVKRFINGWLAKQQDKAKLAPGGKTARPEPLNRDFYVHAEVLDRLCEARLDGNYYQAESHLTFRFPLSTIVDEAFDLVKKIAPRDEEKRDLWMTKYYRSYIFGTAHRQLRKAWVQAA